MNLLEEFSISLGAGKNDFHPQLTDFAVRRHDVIGPRRRLDAKRLIGRRTLDRTQPVEHEHVFNFLKHRTSLSRAKHLAISQTGELYTVE